MTKKTHEKFMEEVSSTSTDFEVLGKYTGADDKIEFKHTCGYIWITRPSRFLSSTKCPRCSLKAKALAATKTTSSYTAEVMKLVGDEYTVVGEYKGSLEKISIKHNTCGEVIKPTASAFLNDGVRCYSCFLKTITKTPGKFSLEVENEGNGDYSIITPYINSTTKVELHYLTCGNIYSVLPADFKKGKRCPKCAQHGFNVLKPAILYYFKIDNVYKIGVSNNTLEKRYKATDRARMSKIQIWNFDIGREAYDYEQEILKSYAEYKYMGPSPFSDKTKISECFHTDIYNLKDVHDV